MGNTLAIKNGTIYIAPLHSIYAGPVRFILFDLPMRVMLFQINTLVNFGACQSNCMSAFFFKNPYPWTKR